MTRIKDKVAAFHEAMAYISTGGDTLPTGTINRLRDRARRRLTEIDGALAHPEGEGRAWERRRSQLEDERERVRETIRRLSAK